MIYLLGAFVILNIALWYYSAVCYNNMQIAVDAKVAIVKEREAEKASKDANNAMAKKILAGVVGRRVAQIPDMKYTQFIGSRYFN